MNLLLDSHTLLWALHDPERLRPDAADALRDPKRAVFFSAASVWEMELKAAKGKLTLPENWVQAALQCGFLHLHVSADETQDSVRLPWLHSDPFDRLLIAQARKHHLSIATRDERIPGYEVSVLNV